MTKKALVIRSVPVALLAIFGVFLWVSLGDDGTKRVVPSALLDAQFPSFRLSDLLDKNSWHTDLPKGQPMLVNVWATWCPGCYVEHPYLVKLAAQGVRIIGVNFKDNRTQAVAFLAEKGDPFHLSLYDEKGVLAVDLGVTGAPETYFVDSGGVIRYRHVGIISEQNWTKILAGKLQALSN